MFYRYRYSSSVLRAYLYALFHMRRFEELFQAIAANTFEQKYFEELQDLWYKARYAENEQRRQKELGAVEKYRLRKKHPPPRSIWDGQETIYSFKENARKVLRQFYKRNKYPTLEDKKEIARITDLQIVQISNWFKNRRQRDKSSSDRFSPPVQLQFDRGDTCFATEEEVYDPYAKLRNLTGIVCIVFILLCILYTLWDIAARLFDCFKIPTPKYLPSNLAVTTKSAPPHQHLHRPPPPSRHVSSSLCGNSYAAMDTLDAPARSAVKPARFINKEGPPSEAPIDDLVNTLENTRHRVERHRFSQNIYSTENAMGIFENQLEAKRESKAVRTSTVFLTGSFVDWIWKIPMRKSDSNDEWSAMIELLPGHHEYKFIVDSKWRIDALNLPTKISNNGHVTHVLHL
ncbi:Homeobox protein SIX4 [Toxocara canis]|uniref:Homeobox protein SIX4 n=1 Tax=Toxocara canis TaxID=6265 RepID=A0A0B2VT99_TOXCA|nr:Homeobox protein SIX4 [Toxocara canis]